MLRLLLIVSSLLSVQALTCTYSYSGTGSYCCGAGIQQSCVNSLNKATGGIYDYITTADVSATLASGCAGTWSISSGSGAGVVTGTVTSESLVLLTYNFGTVYRDQVSDLILTCGAYGITLKFTSYFYYYPPTVTGFSPSTVSAGDSITISGSYLKGNPGVVGVTAATVNGVAATILSVTPTTAVIQTPILVPGSYNVGVTFLNAGSPLVPGTLVYATPAISTVTGQRFSWSTFPTTGGTLYIYGTSYIGVVPSLYTLTSGATTITGSSVSGNIIGFTVPSGTLHAIGNYDLKYQTSMLLASNIPINYGYGLTSFETTEQINLSFTGPWIGYVTVPWTFSRKGAVVTAMSNTSPITSAVFISSASVSSTATTFPTYYRPTNTERCYVHLSVGGVAAEVHIDVNPAGYFTINSNPSGTPFGSYPAIYSTGCTWIVPY